MTSLKLAGTEVQLLASGAMHLKAGQTLLIADLHLGKASSFRQLGVPVPHGTTQSNLQAIDRDLSDTQAQHLIFLGDFLHSRFAHTPALHDSLFTWRKTHAQLPMTLIRGNHDSRAGDPPSELGITIVNEPFLLGAFALCHHPQQVAGHYTLAGHLHPCITLHGKARERLRLPCFWLGDEVQYPVGILPAYGDFTGMYEIERRKADKVYAIAGDVVRRVEFKDKTCVARKTRKLREKRETNTSAWIAMANFEFFSRLSRNFRAFRVTAVRF
ncbi:MAG: ligase-associated DNA damage response endonuclease PdeM [Brachymonas sp.]|nr:ligase-associated DNA damage response endonuclease PdeM [Brachymonas sp.]